MTAGFRNFIRMYSAWSNAFFYYDTLLEDSKELNAYFAALSDDQFLEYYEAYKEFMEEINGDTPPHFLDPYEDYVSCSKMSYEDVYNEILCIDPELYSLVEYARKIPVKMNDMTRVVYDAAHGYLDDMSVVYDACMLKVFRLALAHHKMLNVNLADVIQGGFLGIESAVRDVRWHIKSFYESDRQRILLAINREIEREIWRNTRYSDRGIYLHYYDDLIKVIKYASRHPEFYSRCNDVAYLKSIAKQIPIPVERFIDMCKGHRYEPIDINTVEDEDAARAFEVIEENYELELLREREEYILSTLTPNESKVIRLRFGLDGGNPRTLEEVGKIFDITRERIRQIEAKALRKMRHPSRAKILLSGFWTYCEECGSRFMTVPKGHYSDSSRLCNDCWKYHNAIEEAADNGFEVVKADKQNHYLTLVHDCGFEFDYDYNNYTDLECKKCRAEELGYQVLEHNRFTHILTLKCSCGNVFTYDYSEAFSRLECDECFDYLDDENDLFDDFEFDDD